MKPTHRSLLLIFVALVGFGPLQALAIDPAITTYAWTWLPEGTSPPPKVELRFSQDGVVKSSLGPQWTWRSLGPRALAIEGSAGCRAVLAFDQDFLSFQATGFDGKTKITGTRKTVAASLPAPPVATGPEPVLPAPGIAIAGINQNRTSVLMSSGGHSHELEDVRALLSNYGSPRKDLEEHPKAMIYQEVSYLMPWLPAEGHLAPRYTGMKSGGKIACAGFPDGLCFVSYDGRWKVYGHEYNRMLIVKDIVGQVVCVEYINERTGWPQPEPPWVELRGNWRVIDYVNAEVKGQSDMQIHTQVLDERASEHRIVVHTWNKKIGRATTLFLPEPLIDLMLYCVSDSVINPPQFHLPLPIIKKP